MQRFFRITYLLTLCSFANWLSTGCNNDASDEATPDAPCRIQQSVAVSKSKFYDQTYRITYEYDGNGNLIKTLTTADKRPTSGTIGTQTGTKTDTYIYTPDGYLTRMASDEFYVTTTDKPIREQFTTTYKYSYANGRLSGYTVTRTNAQQTTTTTFSYAYDSAGDVSQIVNDNPSNPTGLSYVYIYQKNELVDYVEKSGTTERRPYTIQNGVITKMTIPGSNDTLVITATADNRQRIIKREEFVNGQLRQYDVQTWTDAKPATAALPPFKGFPTVTLSVFSGKVGVLATRSQFYWNAVSKTMQPYTESLSVVQTNSQNFITSAVTTVNHPATADQNYTTTETYTYTGCR